MMVASFPLAERPALYFTVLGESAIKMLRYQQQYTFFDPAKLPDAIRFINLSQAVLEKDLGAVLEEITKEVEKSNPAVVVVDSFRTMVRKPQSDMDLQSFIQRLALFLASWQATTFLIGEYAEDELRDNPIFTVADGLLWLRQTAERNSIVRKLQIIKLRGQDSVPGLHTFRITDAGVQAFSRTFGLTARKRNPPGDGLQGWESSLPTFRYYLHRGGEWPGCCCPWPREAARRCLR
jgi:circadian clock protein KaiC